MSERTKGEWKTSGTDVVNQEGKIIADCEVDGSYDAVPYDEAFPNAAFICKAVNSFDVLVEVLEETARCCDNTEASDKAYQLLADLGKL